MKPPDKVFFAPGVGRRRFYENLSGVRSAAKTSFQARCAKYNPETYAIDKRVWVGTVTWTEIDLDTGEEIVRESDVLKEMGA